MSFPFEPRIERAATLPARFYLEDEVLAQEQERIFGRTWQLAGRVEQLAEAGDYFTTSVAGEPLIVVRGRDGVIRALSNVCRHRAGPIAAGEGKRPVLQCHYHGWTYALDGSLQTTPEMSGIESFDREAMCLPRFRAEEWNGLLFVNLDDAAPTLRGALAGVIADMPKHDHGGFALAARKEWEIACNWKVYVDNYLEGYHIPIVHPGLFRELDYPKYRTETRGSYSIQFAPTKNADRIRTGNGEGEVRYFWIFPNLMFNVYPDNFSTNVILPLGADRTLTVFEWYFANADSPHVKAAVDATVAFSDEIQLEDIGICEAVQRGLRSRTYTSGRYSPARENGVHHFHGLYAAAMSRIKNQES